MPNELGAGLYPGIFWVLYLPIYHFISPSPWSTAIWNVTAPHSLLASGQNVSLRTWSTSDVTVISHFFDLLVSDHHIWSNTPDFREIFPFLSAALVFCCGFRTTLCPETAVETERSADVRRWEGFIEGKFNKEWVFITELSFASGALQLLFAKDL